MNTRRFVRILLAAMLVASCAAAPRPTLTPWPTSTPAGTATLPPTEQPPVTPTAMPAPTGRTQSPTAEAGACISPIEEPYWLPIRSGRCEVQDFSPAFSFEAPSGWQGGRIYGIVTLTPDDGISRINIYRYGGAVVPDYCTNPRATLVIRDGSDLVEWVTSRDGLDVTAIGRSVGVHPAWQVSIDPAGAPPACTARPDRSGIVALWTIGGEPGSSIEAVVSKGRLVYVIQLPESILFVTTHTGGDGSDRQAIELAAEELLSSLEFE